MQQARRYVFAVSSPLTCLRFLSLITVRFIHLFTSGGSDVSALKNEMVRCLPLFSNFFYHNAFETDVCYEFYSFAVFEFSDFVLAFSRAARKINLVLDLIRMPKSVVEVPMAFSPLLSRAPRLADDKTFLK